MNNCPKSNPSCKQNGGVVGKQFGTLLRSFDPEVNKQAASLKSVKETQAIKIPELFDGRETWKDFLSPIYDQGICAGCYAYSVVSSLADKFAIQSLGQVKPIFNPLESIMCMIDEQGSAEQFIKLRKNISLLQRQQLIRVSKACQGDTIYNIARHLYRWGAVEDSCVSYSKLSSILEDTDQLPVCSIIEGAGLDLCEDNNYAQRCWPIKTFYNFQEDNKDELTKLIMLSVLKWGPLVVAFNVFSDFIDGYDGKTIYTPKQGQKSLGGHAVKIVGWGLEDNIPYWICANSWGEQWGDNGYFKIVRNNELLELEKNHIGLWPQFPSTGGVGASPYTRINQLITDDDIKEREYNNIDVNTFYPTRLLSKIKNKELKTLPVPRISDKFKLPGNPEEIFDVNKLPSRQDFFAYLMLKRSFINVNGELVKYEGKQPVIFGKGGKSEENNKTRKTTMLIIILCLCIILLAAFIFRNRIKQLFK